MSQNPDSSVLIRAQALRDAGIAALRAANTAQARELLSQCVALAPDDARAWLWLSGAVTTDAERRFCLERVLALDPANAAALDGLTYLPIVPVESPLGEIVPAIPTEMIFQEATSTPEEEPQQAVAPVIPDTEQLVVAYEPDTQPVTETPAKPITLTKQERWSNSWMPWVAAATLLALLVSIGTVMIARRFQPQATPDDARVAQLTAPDLLQPTRQATPSTVATRPPKATARRVAAAPTKVQHQPTATASPIPPTPTFAPSATPSPSPGTEGLSAAQLTERGLARERDEQDFVAALADYDAAIQVDPSYADAYFLRSNLRAKRGDMAGANEDFAHAKKLDRNRAKAAYHQGRMFSSLGDIQKAQDSYNEAIRLNPRFDQAYYSRAVDRPATDDVAEAIADLTQAIKINPRFADAYNIRGNLYYNQGNIEQAIADHTEAIQLDSTMAFRFVARAIDYWGLQQYDQAIDDYTQAINLSPNDPKLLCERAEVRITTGSYMSAVTDTTRALELDPGWYCANFNRGRAYYGLGNYRRALEDFTRYVEAQPNQPQAYIARAAAEYALKDIQATIQDYTKAANIYQSQGRTEEYENLMRVIKELNKGVRNV